MAGRSKSADALPKIHPVALLMPEMTDLQYLALKEDIKLRGLRTPILLAPDGRIVDGRHRFRACQELGIEPNYVRAKYKSDAELAREVVSLNLKRRHLTQSQESWVAAQLIPLFEEEARARREQGQTKGRAKNSKKSVERNIALDQSEGADAAEATSTELKDSARKAASDAATMVGVSTRMVEYAKRVQASGTEDVQRAVSRGLLPVQQGARLAKESPSKQDKVWKAIERGEAKNVRDGLRKLTFAEQLEQIKQAPPVVGISDVLVVDPAWTFAKTREDDPTQRGRTPYPTMTEEEIKSIKLPIGKNAIVWLWTTNAHLLSGEALRVLEHWGLKVKGLLTWAKPRMGVGDWLRGQTEHCLLAVKGSPAFHEPVPSTLLTAELGKHSEKPDAFYELVERYCVGTKGELFARKPREGWQQHGVELGSIPANPTTKASAKAAPGELTAEDAISVAIAAAKAKAKAARVPKVPVPVIPPQPAGMMPPIVPNA